MIKINQFSKTYKLKLTKRTITKSSIVFNDIEKLDLNKQASNRTTTWSLAQMERKKAMVGPRFEQTSLDAQPNPMAAIELINKTPIIEVHERIYGCDGGNDGLGHPKIYINLDEGIPKACGYCIFIVYCLGGLRFQFKH